MTEDIPSNVARHIPINCCIVVGIYDPLIHRFSIIIQHDISMISLFINHDIARSNALKGNNI